METTENLGTSAAAESAGQSGTVDAQTIESPNAEIPASAGRPEIADGQTQAAEPAEAPATAGQKPAQTREENAAFARMRRELDQNKAELARYKAMSRAVGEATGTRSEDPDEIRWSVQAQREGVSPDIIRQREAAEKQRVQDQLKNDPEYIRVQQELVYYRQQTAKQQQERDIEELRAKYPADKIDLATLDEQYVKLRVAGVDNLHAYAAVRAVKGITEAEKKPVPPDTGAVGAAAEQQPDFYTPEQVDQLTQKQLDDPKIMEKVMKSMTKWKK